MQARFHPGPRFWFIVWLAALLGAAPARAQEKPESPPERWKLSAELSYTDQTGNKVLRLLTGGLKLSHLQKDRFELDGSLQSRYGRSNGDVVSRNHYGVLSFDFQPQNAWSPFLFANAERDPFKRLDVRLSGGAGAKYTLRRGGANDVSASLALLYTFEDLAATATDLRPRDRHRARWSLRLRGGREITEAVSLQHVTFYQPVWDEVADYLLRSETGAKVILSERLALSLEYQWNRTSLPPAGVEPDDRLFKTGLIIDF